MGRRRLVHVSDDALDRLAGLVVADLRGRRTDEPSPEPPPVDRGEADTERGLKNERSPRSRTEGSSLTDSRTPVGEPIVTIPKNPDGGQVEQLQLGTEAGARTQAAPLLEPVFAIDPNRTTNAQAIHDLYRLGYLRDSDAILDVTWGEGAFWNTWTPARLVGTDLDPERARDQVADFTNLSFENNSFDVVVFDPPYKLNGTSQKGDARDIRYGVAGDYRPRRDVQASINAGIGEGARVARRVLLVKCQDQTSSGSRRWQVFDATTTAIAIGCRLVDRLDVWSYRPQPAGRTQRTSA